MVQRVLILIMVALAGMLVIEGVAAAQEDVSISIGKHGRLTSQGEVIFVARIACGPFPGSPDFQQTFAGADQQKTGAWSEGGLSPDPICDGVERSYTARLSPFEAAFTRGPARANASLFACYLVGDEQRCAHAAAERRIVIGGRLVP